MKLGILNGAIDFLDQKYKEMFDSTEEIQKHQTELNEIRKPKSDNEIRKPKSDNEIQKPKSDNEIQKPKSDNEIQKPKSDNEIQKPKSDNEILSKISELKASDDFESIYNFLDELSSEGNQKFLSKAYEEGLSKKTAPKKYKWEYERNGLHEACKRGNLNLVKSLVRAGCENEAKSNRNSPLFHASIGGNLEVVKYLIYIGASKEITANGRTPLIFASENGHAEVVKFLISIGAIKSQMVTNGL
ncbi:hypothetical protein TVAG_091130 [Trichomonas vaginalis G3]|uniref:Uncharacterized protein n=1 Tax=Trichomonas vaginalis (strain ATCC PRA-98 / G3) TaxID=412133 RepID=A2F617_TRIV3|nr:protein ubiquitination [Trichomonas vaginalis G3]EAX99646.1 hypothetical protein TVAG_091130 [Trichomonas vaginalis G3]KAI5522429.1 protein ubiquitination [Trichomonas vaginalis G3]|eukprot:XP_001312576.1 hypothetical protein [Trichomonas vaginalis G3]